jgi:hypothetical protein
LGYGKQDHASGRVADLTSRGFRPMTRPDQPKSAITMIALIPHGSSGSCRTAVSSGIYMPENAKRAVRLKLNPDSSTNEAVCPDNANQT